MVRRVHLPLFKSMSYLAADRRVKYQFLQLMVSKVVYLQVLFASRVTARKKRVGGINFCIPGAVINDVTFEGLWPHCKNMLSWFFSFQHLRCLFLLINGAIRSFYVGMLSLLHPFYRSVVSYCRPRKLL